MFLAAPRMAVSGGVLEITEALAPESVSVGVEAVGWSWAWRRDDMLGIEAKEPRRAAR
jgi:hypothetical protein